MPHLITVIDDVEREETDMRVDELAPAPGSNKAKSASAAASAARAARPPARHQGPAVARRGKVARGFEGGQMPLKQRVPKLKGFNNPFRVEYSPVNLDQTRRAAASRRSTPTCSSRKGSSARAPSSRSSPVARSPRKVDVTPTPSRRRPRRPSPPQAVASRCCRCPSSRVARRSRATSSPTADTHDSLPPSRQGSRLCCRT